jgi:nitrite reductase/ring-hydroxylating ferredoxin subunit
MSVEVARVSEIPPGTMKRVTAFNKNFLLSNVGGRIYATQNECGHQRASLARGTLEGSVVTCPLHGAKFDVTTGRNVGGVQTRMSPELMQKMPQEVIAMFQKSGEIMSEIDIRPLKTYTVEVKGDSVCLEDRA